MGQLSPLIHTDMKKTFLSILAILALSASIFAQDGRQRTVSTIVGDALAQLPAATAADFNREVGDLAASAPESIVVIAKMFQAPEKGANNKLEYAVAGIVNYATTPGNEKYREAVVKGLEQAIDATVDATAKAFFGAQLRLLGKPEACDNCCSCEGLTAKEMLAKAKELAKSDQSNLRCQSLWILDKIYGAKNASNVISALKDSDHAYRMTALQTAESYANDAFYAKLAKAYKSVPTEAKTDILYWLGEQKAASQLPFILKQIGKSNSAEAIASAGKIGGDEAAEALIKCLGTSDAPAAIKALTNFNGNARACILAALPKASGTTLKNLITLASKRHITEAAPQILGLCQNSDPDALEALAGVVSADNIGDVAKLLDGCKAKNETALSNALYACVAGMKPNEQYKALSEAMLEADNMDKFYVPIAKTGSNKGAEMLIGAYTAGSQKALDALATMDNIVAAPAMLRAAGKDQKYLAKYIDLIASSNKSEGAKTGEFIKALAAAKTPELLNKAIAALATTPNVAAIDAVAPYMDNKDAAHEAAWTVKKIGAVIPTELPYEKLESLFTKASSILSATGDADDGYAVDEMRNVLSNNKPYPISELTAEEKAAGFIMLYDGTNLDNFIGDKANYISMNGAINVFANYGGEGNLYTAEEYHNFIWRFEFCFLRPAVNNGIGVRTPCGVDAAYDGMCEVQILDHDDPVYAGLNVYQVHGSAYGIIPAKRIVHKPIGEWSEEEIKVVDNHVTVTVNGQVILDGDLKEACQGHNVAPDGSNYNPYTVDHRNHPGMFNEKGHVSFCGHGRGLQFRNVRILPLD